MSGKVFISSPDKEVIIDIGPIMLNIQTLLKLAEYTRGIDYDKSSEMVRTMAYHIVQIKKYVAPKIDIQRLGEKKDNEQ